MERVYLDKFEGGAVGGAAANHIRNVLRLRPGGTFAGYDGAREFILRVESSRGGEVNVSVESGRELPEAPGARVTLAPALIKGPRWDWLLEKSVELGVGEIIPVAAARCVVRAAGAGLEGRMERWRRILGGAAAQCAGRAPAIRAPVAFKQLTGGVAAAFSARIILMKGPESAPLAESLRGAASGRIMLLIGPEGGWTEEEAAAAIEAGFRPGSLGPLILRAETAAIAAAAVAANI
jgi:16S rRNA (uracil1498-N3)-methyltransferase